MRSFAVLPLLAVFLVSLCGSPVPPPPSDVSGTVYFDANHNGMRDSCDSPAFGGVSVAAVAEDGTRVTDFADTEGVFHLKDVPQGDTLVTMDAPTDTVWPMSTHTEDGQGGTLLDVGFDDVKGVELGVTRLSAVTTSRIALSVIAFDDKDRDGEADAGECPIERVAVHADGTRTQPSPSGVVYLVADSVPSILRLTMPSPCGTASTNDNLIGCQAWMPTSKLAGCWVVTPDATADETIYEVFEGFYRGSYTTSIVGVVYRDENGNQTMDAGEAGVSDAAVWAEEATSECGDLPPFPFSVQTSAGGKFVASVPPGTYRLRYDVSHLTGGRDILTESNVDGVTVEVTSGLTEISLPVDVQPGARVEVAPFHDRNGDGIRDPGEEVVHNLGLCAYTGGPLSGTFPEGEPTGYDEVVCNGYNKLDRADPDDYFIGPLKGGEYELQARAAYGFQLPFSITNAPFTFTAVPGDDLIVELPIDVTTADEQLIHDSPDAFAWSMVSCLDDPDWTKRPFDEGYDPTKPFYRSWSIDEQRARRIYDRGLFVIGTSEPDHYVWQSIAGVNFSNDLQGCRTHTNPTMPDASVVFLLAGAEVTESYVEGAVREVVLRDTGDQGVRILGTPLFPNERPNGEPRYIIFVDEAYTPLMRCADYVCENY